MGKKALCLIFAFLLSINSFAAVVSDNDGSAFITKAEFDSLKNDFQSQIDSYNANIDNKVDNAIASYLAGISVNKQNEITSNLSKNGTLPNGTILKWSSSTSAVFGNNAINDKREIIEIVGVYAMMNSSFKSLGYSWTNYYDSSWGTDYSVANRKYETSKLIKNMRLNDGTIVNGYQRGKVACYLNWWFLEYQPNGAVTSGSTWSPSAPENMNSNYSNIYQNTRNLYNQICSGAKESWHSWSSMTIDTHDISLDGEEYTLAEELMPLSTANDLYWDSTKNDVCVTLEGGNVNRAWSTATNLYWAARVNGGTGYGAVSINGGPSLMRRYRAPWMEQTHTANNIYLYSLNQIDKRHRKVKNGFIVGETKDAGDYYIEFEADTPGTLYAIVGAPIDFSTEADLAYWIQFPEANKQYTLKLENITFLKNPIWICFLPTSTTVKGTLKINRLYYEKKE